MAPPVTDEPVVAQSQHSEADVAPDVEAEAEVDTMRPPPVSTDTFEGSGSIRAMETAQRHNAEPFVQLMQIRFDEGPIRLNQFPGSAFETHQRYPSAKFEGTRDPNRLDPNSDSAANARCLFQGRCQGT